MATRRGVLFSAAAAPLVAGGCAGGAPTSFPDWPAAAQAVDSLRGGGWRSRAEWDLARTLHHLAQSVECSIAGFPQLKPAWFRATVGRTAFAVFDARGRMSHGLTDPIPGAPALANGQPLDAAITRLQQAMAAFDAHAGALQPHFAYGLLDKAAYARAHLMHLAEHWSQFERS
jgi:hypothetical protein